MKKQLMISTALLASTTPMVAMANIKTDETTNPTELNIQTKDITENLYIARNMLIEFSDEPYDPWLWSYGFEDVLIVVPDIQQLYLNDDELSYGYDNHLSDDAYRVGIEMDIELEYSVEWDNESNDDSIIINKENTPLYLENINGRLEWTENVASFIEKDHLWWDDEWVYDLSLIGEGLMKDLRIREDTYAEILIIVQEYVSMVKPFIINGNITWTENIFSPIKYTESWKISEDSYSNEISVYAQRYEIGNTDPSLESLFYFDYLIEEDTFDSPIIEEPIIEEPIIEESNSGLSPGEITGIVIGSIAAAAAMIGLGFGISSISSKKTPE